MAALGDVMANRVQAHWKVLLTDACHSGKINAETTNEALDLQFNALPRSFLTLTATREREQSHEARGDYDPAMLLGVGTVCPGTADPESPSLLGTAIVESNMNDVDLYIDGELVGTVSRDRPLTIPRLSSGLHEFMVGVREGYEPDTKQIMIAPGQEVTVTLRIRYVRRIEEAALELGERGERLLFSGCHL